MPAGIIKGYKDTLHIIHGIFVGINEYEVTRDPKKFDTNGGVATHRIGQLRGCVNDAKDIMDSMGSDSAKDLLDAQATRTAIFGEINTFMRKETDVQKKSDFQSSDLKGQLLILSISAHGIILPETEEFCIVPYDYDPANGLGTGFSTVTLINAMSIIARRGGKVLLILDACHAGGINFDISKYSGLFAQGGVSCLSSCSAGEQSYEVANKHKRPGGIFTHHLVEGLNGAADTGKTEVITLRNLYDYTYEKVSEEYDQHPQLIGTLDGNTVIKKLKKK